MNELLQTIVECKKMAEDASSDADTQQYYRKMLVDVKMYLDGISLLRDNYVPTEQPVVNEIKEPTPPVVKQKPKAVSPKEPPIVDRVKKSPVRKPPVKKQQKPQQKVRGNEGKPPKRPTKPTKTQPKAAETVDTKEEFF
jgi:outer membrane biosynthesis protein TonB